MMPELILSANNVTKSFDNRENVLSGVSLKVYKGDFISILGASGSGKSTLISILGGMDVPTEGEVIFEDKNLALLKEKDLAKLRRTKSGFVFQFFNLAPYLTVKENILLPLILDGKSPKKYEQKLNELVDYLKIKDLLNAMPTKLSGGEQQRVAIARALIYEPRIIFLDEPTGNLDSKNSTEIMNLLKKINQELNTTILQVTHSEENASYGNRIIRINDGLIVEDIVIETRYTEENETVTEENETAIEEQNNAETKVEEKTEIEE